MIVLKTRVADECRPNVRYLNWNLQNYFSREIFWNEKGTM